MSIKIETTHQPALVQINSLYIPDFLYEAEEEFMTRDPLQAIPGSPTSTIPFDENSPSQQLPSERIGEGAGSSSVIEISDSEENRHTRPRRRCRRRTDKIDHATSAMSIDKRKRQDSNIVDFQSRIVSSSGLFFRPG